MYSEGCVLINGVIYDIGYNGDLPKIDSNGNVFLSKFKIDKINEHLKTLNEIFIARSDRGLMNPELINLNIDLGFSFIKSEHDTKTHCIFVLNDELPIDHNGSNMWFLRKENIKDKSNINIIIPLLTAGDFDESVKIGTIYTFKGV